MSEMTKAVDVGTVKAAFEVAVMLEGRLDTVIVIVEHKLLELVAFPSILILGPNI